MKIIERLKIIAVAALLKIVAIFGHGLVKKPLKPADVLIRGSMKTAEFSLGRMDENNRTASGPNVVINRPMTSPPPVTSHRGSQKRKDSKRPF
jgi:hypothetical protein